MPQLTDKNDEDLMLLTGKGNKKAFEELVKRHTRPLQNYFYRYFRNIEDSKDYAQQVFVQIFQSAKRYRRLSKFTTWMYTVARNLYINEIARRQKVRFSPLEFAENKGTRRNMVEDAVTGTDTAHFVRKSLDALPAEFKEVLVLQVYQDLKCAEIAKLLKIPEGTVWSRLHYGLKLFKKEYEKVTGEHEL